MALSWALHDVSPSSLKPGDHIYRWSSLVHVHHGIVLEKPDGNQDLLDSISVLHIPATAGVEAKQVTLNEFLAKGSLKLARYGVPPIEVWIKRSGTCYAERSSPVDEVVARALALLQKSEQHCVMRAFRGATSEDIAFWCKTGKSRAETSNSVGGTNYNQTRTSCAHQYASNTGATRGGYAGADPSASSSPTNAEEATTSMEGSTLTMDKEVDKSMQCRDPDAFLLLQEEANAQQVQTPQSIRRIDVPTDDADLEDYEVVDLPPWLPAEHYPAAVNAA
eukprot:gnl/MRDRNA2_/MRDRNA2_125005_c0_seq1.p1 gnl/MRDRNA2_/MRDRNA2_125005_c0~~gnl/MRDRNA2_/MRDRNA2_125005_c0_seq1.p1  ORF type:complete len:302 (+),score=58.40 gnl/MRDRNA2_/MRDRNA2_125005_c0_seq1:75-908(+)